MQLEDLTQPTPGTTQNDSNNRNEGAENDRGEDDQYAPDIGFDDRHGPLKADGSLTDQTGLIPNTFQAVNAFDIDDFALSNLRHVLWVPKSCLLLWGQVFSEITWKLIEAIGSDGSARHRRIGTAARWYLGMPQIFLRDPARGQERNAKIIERRLTQFIAGDYSNILSEWRADTAARHLRQQCAEIQLDGCLAA